MPRPLYQTEPTVINTLSGRGAATRALPVATGNPGKLAEMRRLLPDYDIVGVKLDIEEIQSLDAHKVARHKAIAAYKANDCNPSWSKRLRCPCVDWAGDRARISRILPKKTNCGA